MAYIGNQPVPQATQTRDRFTATSGQTSFATSGYTPGFLDVYLNGVHLDASDYTATNGSDVVLASGAASGDVLEVVAYSAFEAANALPSQTGNTGKYLTTDGSTASWSAVDLASRVAKSGDTMTGGLNLPTLNATTQVNINGSLLADATRIALPAGSSDPSTPATGQMYWSTGSSKIKVYNGSAWRTIANADVDPYWAQVSLYLRGGSLTDLKGVHSVSSVNASLATQPGKPFVGADSTSWYQLSTSSSTAVYLDIGTNLDDFDPSQNTALTIEFWLWKPAGYGSYGHFYNIGGQDGQGVMKFAGDSSYGLYWYSSNGEGINWGGSGTFTTGTWTHFVYEKNGSTQTTWRNGTRINQNTNALPSGAPTFMRLGYLYGSEYCPHYFDELRVTKAARYQGVSTIPVQSAPYPTE